MSDTLKAQVMDDMKDAMRKKEPLRLSTIRLLIAAIKQREIDEKTILNDIDITKLIYKMIKQRQDAGQQFKKAGRDELAEKEQKEIAILEGYLPEPMSDEEIETVVKNAIEQTGAKTIKDMGKIMAALKSELEGRVDIGLVSEKIKTLLS